MFNKQSMQLILALTYWFMCIMNTNKVGSV